MTQFAGEFGGVFGGKNVLVTGHTGFKGSWLCLWLQTLGAKVSGLALPPATQPDHFDLLKLPMDDRRGDIRDAALVRDAFAAARPAIVFHMAAQPLVRASLVAGPGSFGQASLRSMMPSLSVSTRGGSGLAIGA